MCEVHLRNRAGNLHCTLSNEPPLWPELVRKRAGITGVPMDYERVDRNGRSLRKVAEREPLLLMLEMW